MEIVSKWIAKLIKLITVSKVIKQVGDTLISFVTTDAVFLYFMLQTSYECIKICNPLVQQV